MKNTTDQLDERRIFPFRGLGVPVVWLHCDSNARLSKFNSLSEAILQADESAGVILTYPAGQAAPPEMPRRVCIQSEPDDAALVRLVAKQTRIATALVGARQLPDGMIVEWSRRGTAVILAEVALPRLSAGWSFAPGKLRRLLKRVTHVYLSNERQRDHWVKAGMPLEKLSVVGSMSQAPLALKCNETEREMLADSFRHRTVWLAVGVPEAEEQQVLDVHREVLRASHRLLLILHPADPMRGPKLYELFSKHFNTSLRSRDDPITSETQVYIADTEGERGLWYRLAVMCYMGGSFSDGSVFNPMEAAGLGCAIVHGPEGGSFGDVYELLAERRATRRLVRADALGRILSAALRPELAADMAHAGWQIVSEGTEATETLVAALLNDDKEQC